MLDGFGNAAKQHGTRNAVRTRTATIRQGQPLQSGLLNRRDIVYSVTLSTSRVSVPADVKRLDMVCSIELQEDPKVKVNLSETFIRRPIATSLLMLAIAMFSVIAYGGLSVSDLPG